MISIQSFGVALFLAVASVPAPSLRFAPVEKSSLVKTLASDSKIASTQVTISMDGQELPAEMIGEMSFAMTEQKKLVITDRYMKVADGRPIELDRTYDELVSTSTESSPSPDGPQEKEKAETSDLEGATVRFSWKADKEEYEKKFADGDRSEDLLEGLEEDLDFRGLLPSEDVKVEGTWELEAKAFEPLFALGGSLHFHEEGKEPEEKKNESFDEQLSENLAGKGKATFESIREKDGRKLAVIAIEAELTSTAKEPESELDCKLAMKVEGSLIWDMEANRIESFDVTGDLGMDMSGDQTQDMGGSEHTISIRMRLEGKLRLELTTKAG
jgi:hypothetical protein